MTAKLRLGYVGVGLMGLPMVKRLASLKYAIRAYDILVEKTAAAVTAGAAAASSPADAAQGADLVLLNLPTTDAVERAVFGENGVAGALKPPQLVVDFSTIKVEKCRAFGEKLRAGTGCGWIDAPVSGGPPASGSGTLTIMAGGEAADIAKAQPLFADIAGRFTHMGPPAAGMATKMLNQLIVGAGHAVMAEAVVLAEAAGIDAARLPECLAGGLADSALLQKLYPRMQRREFAPQGYVRQLLKDLEMVSEYAAGLKAPTPLMSEALQLYRIVAHLGHTELDTAAVLKVYDREST
ncbi:MAG: NAD(P)-dependent oxidoreductase [Betaproteobacteria bacterium]|nr:NAD(P)-dependent oxidoreductase [Betaproteobacteria bacterium]MDH5211096.1 NAD(P)-dependent oxidoreductase [Betaproteobacteria bacterium]